MEFRQMALMMPTGMPTSHEMTMAMRAIWPLMGARRRMMSRMGSLRQKDLPSSPRATSAIHLRYCSWRGLSRPRLARAAWRSSSFRM